MNDLWHFPIMILVSFILFFAILGVVLGKKKFSEKKRIIFLLAILVVIIGMLIGKYGANWGFPWWLYYPIPMLMNVVLPPVILKMSRNETLLYLLLSFIAAPVIHITFSILLGWTEYMPFWKVIEVSSTDTNQ